MGNRQTHRPNASELAKQLVDVALANAPWQVAYVYALRGPARLVACQPVHQQRWAIEQQRTCMVTVVRQAERCAGQWRGWDMTQAATAVRKCLYTCIKSV